MKRVLLICTLALGVSASSRAQLLLNENFSDLTPGNLSGQGGWITQASNPDIQVVAPSASNPSLVVSNYVSGINFITTGNDGGKDPYKNFNNNVAANANTTFFISFVVRVANSSATTSTSNALQSVALRTVDGNSLCYFYIGDNGGNLRFGISKSESNQGDGSFSSNNYNFNQTYLIVIRYDIDRSNPPGGSVSAENNDEMYLWVNPNISEMPSTASAIRTLTDGTDDGTYSSSDQISALQVFQQYSSNFFNTYYSAAASFDGFKVSYATGQGSTAANAASAWDELSPVGAPLPVDFTRFTAVKSNGGTLLTWNVANEANVARYEVEKNSGSGFVKIGEVAASQKPSYSFTDAKASQGTVQYRVRNVDIDGAFKYTNIINFKNGASSANLRAFPMPVQSRVTVQHEAVDNGKISITSIDGKLVKSLVPAKGSIQTELNLSELKAGVYLLRFDAGNGKMETLKIVKQ